MQNESRLEKMIQESNMALIDEQIHQYPCPCQICTKDVRPIRYPPSPRERSANQYLLKQIQALAFFLQKSSDHGHPRMLYVPDIYLIQSSLYCYTNETGRLRVKTGISSYEAKKMFEQRRKKNRHQIQSSMSTLARQKNKQKQNNIVVIRVDGSRQLINEVQMKRIFSKRKNDSFWLQAAAIYYLPVTKKVLQNHQWTYIRNHTMGNKMQQLIDKIGKQIDNYDEKINIDDGYKNNRNMINQMNMSMTMLQVNNLQKSTPNSLKLSQNFDMVISQDLNSLKSQNFIVSSIDDLFLQSIAYLEISSQTRILSAKFQYIYDDDNKPFLTSIKQLIAHDLTNWQSCYLHDRYKPLEDIGHEQLLKLKKQLDEQDESQLWKLCISILSSCIQQRKVKLKIKDFEKPSNQSLKQIFMKFFPDFNAENMLKKVNWKNDLPIFMEKARKHINYIIQQDQGVSVLKRYGIIFHRTF